MMINSLVQINKGSYNVFYAKKITPSNPYLYINIVYIYIFINLNDCDKWYSGINYKIKFQVNIINCNVKDLSTIL